ncbi:Uma2 family endonuclease [Streptomyces sp. UH6]|nr:Uma2 family endonuclease [Streptomyces sp. UH6]
MDQEEFEELARTGYRINEALRLECVEGRVVEQPLPDGSHSTIVAWLTRLCFQARPDRWLYHGLGLRVDEGRRRTGIPVYLLIDRDTCEVKVHSEPEGDRYTRQVVVPYGKTVTLPDPVGIELDTEPLKEWTR